MNENQVNQHGGKRKGAGRKLGSSDKPKITDYMTEKEITDLVSLAKEQAKEKPELLKFLIEQYFGKARQQIELSGGEEPIGIEVRNKSDKLIKDFLNENSASITRGGQGNDKGSVLVWKEE